jgi:hypothetical protein
MRLALLMLLPALADQENEADKQFRDLEKTVADAEAAHAVSDLVLTGKAEGRVRVAPTFARGNKSRSSRSPVESDKRTGKDRAAAISAWGSASRMAAGAGPRPVQSRTTASCESRK